MNQETRIIQQSVFFLRCFGAEVLAANQKSWREGCPLGTGHREPISATKRPQNCAVTAHSSRIWSMSLPDGCKKHTFLDFADHNVLDNQLSNIAVVSLTTWKFCISVVSELFKWPPHRNLVDPNLRLQTCFPSCTQQNVDSSLHPHLPTSVSGRNIRARPLHLPPGWCVCCSCLAPISQSHKLCTVTRHALPFCIPDVIFRMQQGQS